MMKQWSLLAAACIALLSGVQLKGKIVVTDRPVYFVVLAGGDGTRLWPLSRRSLPKQLLTIDSEKTLLEQALDRVRPLAGDDSYLWVLTTTNHEKAVSDRLGRYVGQVVIEPVARNTGPAIIDCCLRLFKTDPEAQVVFLPADAFIPTSDELCFMKTVEDGLAFSQQQDGIVLFGIKPRFAATGYGYIESDQSTYDPLTEIFKVKRFHEKPSHELAVEYIQKQSMYWNACMFCGKVSTFIDEFKQTCPDVLQAVVDYQNGVTPYASVPSISIDYAVIERSQNTWVKPCYFSWCDVGNLAVFLDLKQQYVGLKKNLISVNASNNLVDVPDKLVALVGVDNLCIVQTEDALLISKREDAEQVRSVVNQLKEDESIEYL